MGSIGIVNVLLLAGALGTLTPSQTSHAPIERDWWLSGVEGSKGSYMLPLVDKGSIKHIGTKVRGWEWLFLQNGMNTAFQTLVEVDCEAHTVAVIRSYADPRTGIRHEVTPTGADSAVHPGSVDRAVETFMCSDGALSPDSVQLKDSGLPSSPMDAAPIIFAELAKMPASDAGRRPAAP